MFTLLICLFLQNSIPKLSRSHLSSVLRLYNERLLLSQDDPSFLVSLIPINFFLVTEFSLTVILMHKPFSLSLPAALSPGGKLPLLPVVD